MVNPPAPAPIARFLITLSDILPAMKQLFQKIKQFVIDTIRFFTYDIWRISSIDSSVKRVGLYNLLKSFILAIRNIRGGATQHTRRSADIQHPALHRTRPRRPVRHRPRLRIPEHRPERAVPLFRRPGRPAPQSHGLHRPVDRIRQRRRILRRRHRTAALHGVQPAQQNREQLQRHLANPPGTPLCTPIHRLPRPGGHHPRVPDLQRRFFDPAQHRRRTGTYPRLGHRPDSQIHTLPDHHPAVRIPVHVRAEHQSPVRQRVVRRSVHRHRVPDIPDALHRRPDMDIEIQRHLRKFRRAAAAAALAATVVVHLSVRRSWPSPTRTSANSTSNKRPKISAAATGTSRC